METANGEVPSYIKDGYLYETRATRKLDLCRQVFADPTQIETTPIDGKVRTQLTPDFATQLGVITTGMLDGTSLSAVLESDQFTQSGFESIQRSQLRALFRSLEAGRHGEPRGTLGEVRSANAADLLAIHGVDEWGVAFLEYAIPKDRASQ